MSKFKRLSYTKKKFSSDFYYVISLDFGALMAQKMFQINNKLYYYSVAIYFFFFFLLTTKLSKLRLLLLK